MWSEGITSGIPLIGWTARCQPEKEDEGKEWEEEEECPGRDGGCSNRSISHPGRKVFFVEGDLA